MKKTYCDLESLIYAGNPKTGTFILLLHTQNGVEIAKSSLDNVSKRISLKGSQNIIADLKGPYVKYNLHKSSPKGKINFLSFIDALLENCKAMDCLMRLNVNLTLLNTCDELTFQPLSFG